MTTILLNEGHLKTAQAMTERHVLSITTTVLGLLRKVSILGSQYSHKSYLISITGLETTVKGLVICMQDKYISHSKHLLYSLALAIIATSGSAVFAQATNQAIYLPPGQSNQGAPPPPGDGQSSAMVTPGDSQRENVATGRPTSNPEFGAFETNGITHQQLQRRSRVNLLMNNKVVYTYEPDQLTNEQRGQVQGIVPAAAANVPYQNVSVSKDQLAQVQQALAPSPNLNAGQSAVPMPDGRMRNQIFTDSPSGTTLSQNGTNNVKPKLLIVQKFARYLVILGIVCACLFMAFAATSLIFGDRNAAGRIVGSAGGIMLLLMGYAIWKVVRFNENNARGPVNRVVIGKQPVLTSRGSPGDVKAWKGNNPIVSTTQANLPVIPTNPGGIQRSGLPLQPLGGAH